MRPFLSHTAVISDQTAPELAQRQRICGTKHAHLFWSYLMSCKGHHMSDSDFCQMALTRPPLLVSGNWIINDLAMIEETETGCFILGLWIEKFGVWFVDNEHKTATRFLPVCSMIDEKGQYSSGFRFTTATSVCPDDLGRLFCTSIPSLVRRSVACLRWNQWPNLLCHVE